MRLGVCKERSQRAHRRAMFPGRMGREALTLALVRMDAARRADMVEDEPASYHRGHENGYWRLNIPLS